MFAKCTDVSTASAAVILRVKVQSIDLFHKWRVLHENEARMLFSQSILVSNYQTSVTTTNSLSQDYTNLDDHISQTSIHLICYYCFPHLIGLFSVTWLSLEYALGSLGFLDECPLMHCALKTSLAAIFWATKFVWFLYPSVSEQSLV